MVQIELEITPLVVGFSFGAIIFLIHRLFPPAKSQRAYLASKEPPAPPEPAEEPGPEPLPEEEPARSCRQKLLWLLALPLLVLASAVPNTTGPEQPAGPLVLVTENLTSAGVIAVEESEPPPEVPTAVDVELVAEVEEAAEAEQKPEAVQPPITLNLTRQTMVVQSVGDIVHYKSAYWGTVNVGTPSVDYKVVFDTGSGYLILPSTYCHSETCRWHKRYRRAASSSAKDIDFDGTEVKVGEPRDEMTISFGTGEVTGVLVEETMCLGAGTGQPSSLDSAGCMPLALIIATDMTEEPFKTFHFDGVMGLGLLGLSKSPQFSLIHNVGKSLDEHNNRDSNIFSVFLGDHPRETSDITFGGYVEDHLQEEISWNPVLHPELGHWMLRVKSLRIDDEVIDFCTEGCRAIVDTGTSLLAVPAPAFPQIHELLRHEAGPNMDCKGPGPQLHIELEGFTMTLDPEDYSKLESSLFGSPPQSPIRFEDVLSANDTIEAEPEYCKPTLMSMDLPEPVGPKLFVLGEPVLRKYYTVFDFTESAPRIGFGRASHMPPSPDDYWGDDLDDELP